MVDETVLQQLVTKIDALSTQASERVSVRNGTFN